MVVVRGATLGGDTAVVTGGGNVIDGEGAAILGGCCVCIVGGVSTVGGTTADTGEAATLRAAITGDAATGGPPVVRGGTPR